MRAVVVGRFPSGVKPVVKGLPVVESTANS